MFDASNARKATEFAAARVLRADGWSYKKIASELGISPSSALHWTRDIQLTQDQINFNSGRGIAASSETVNIRARAWSAKSRMRRSEYQLQGRKTAREGDPLHEAGCMLYWAEGAKDRNTLRFCNSDVHMVRFFVGFTRKCFELGPDDLTLRLNVYLDNGLEIGEIEECWLSALDLPRSCLRKHQINHFPTSSSGEKKSLPYGVCTVRVKKSTRIIQHIYGAIQEYGGFEEPKWLG
jgi:hypothetical protein